MSAIIDWLLLIEFLFREFGLWGIVKGLILILIIFLVIRVLIFILKS